MRSKTNHLERYGGKGTWALVTGASDGIGLEFCKQLASSGFNICLVSRSEGKLKGVVENELASFGVKTKIVVADFAQNAKMSFYDEIVSQVKDLDIGLVVLNAGVSNSGFVGDIEIEQLEQMLDVNVYQYSVLTYKLAKMLEARKAERSGILMVSSLAAQLPGAQGFVVYGASKIFVKYLCEIAVYENGLNQGKRSKIDIECLQPGYVKTKLIK
mmetsp:Transcript_17949/g.24102  ORF Transcript_17949/g.24102 Transcript_17949/m.24102 type:complete len:214 (-) Transcript_17949:390-1031(-)